MSGERAVGSKTELRSFRSRSHPEGQTLATIFGIRYVRPLAAAMIPAMIVALVVVLQAGDVLQFIRWSFPIAMLVAAVWTSYRLRTVTVEIVVSPRGARALTAYEVLKRRKDLGMQRVFDIRRADAFVEVTIGLSLVRLQRADWSELTELLESLEAARQFYL